MFDAPDVATLVHTLFEVVLETSHDVEVQVGRAVGAVDTPVASQRCVPSCAP